MRIKSLFYKIYFSVLAIATILLAVSLFALNGWLKNYENAQPETIVNNIIENLNNINDVIEYNNIVVLLNEIIPSINSLYKR